MNLLKKGNSNENMISSLSQSTFATYINRIIKPLDSKYYFSTIKFSKRLPLTHKNKLSQKFSRQYALTNNIYNKLTRNHSSKSINDDNTNKNSNKIEEYKKKDNLIKNPKVNNKNKSNIQKLDLIKKEKSLDSINVKMQIMEHYLRKQKEKMNQAKFRFFKIVKHNNQNECRYFKFKNEKFNKSLNFFFKSNYYIKKNLEYHKRFHFGPNYLNIGNESTKHCMELIENENFIKLNSNSVLNSLNPEDKKLIYSDPYYFFRDNKYLYKLTNTKLKSLLDRLIEEEEEEKYEEYLDDDLDFEKYYQKGKSKSMHAPKIRNITKTKKSKTIESAPTLDQKFIDKIVNQNLNERLKHLKLKKNPVEKEMREHIRKINENKRKENIFQNNKQFYKTFHIRTNVDYFKSFSLKKNKERLLKDKLFSEKTNQRNMENDQGKLIINKYKRELEEIYDKEKKYKD